MKAQEMFEELGFKKIIKDSKVYRKDKKDIIYSIETNGYRVNIIFEFKHKKVSFYNIDEFDFNCKLLKAINKQFKELGWLDE